MKAFDRADDSPFPAAEVAVGKAWTASSFGIPTHTWSAYPTDLQLAQLTHHPRLMAVGGGYPCSRAAGASAASGSRAAPRTLADRPPRRHSPRSSSTCSDRGGPGLPA
ncbi:heme-binding protein [Streptomyces monashensis]|uniref:heme-binding protein n=1 Tax=Streptomyces monashensis TaxID=1678012 RepID=UPI0033F94342